MSEYNFSIPSRQSSKGIIVIFGYSLYKILRASIILILAFFFKYFQGGSSGFISIQSLMLYGIAALIIFLCIAILKYLNFKFYVNDSAFVLENGIINKEEVSINKAKIQNVFIKQNILQQIINVVSLSIETAGDDSTEIEIKALSRPKALALKGILLKPDKKNEDSIDNVQTEDASVFFKASPKLLFLEGISENHFRSFGIILAFIFGIYSDLKDFFDQLDSKSQVTSWFDLDTESFMGILLFNTGIVLVLIVVSFLLSLIRTFLQNFNLTVSQQPEGFEISKGLFNKVNLSLKTSRIQTTSVVTNRFKKALGLYQLRFTQAMVNKKQKEKFTVIGLKKDNLNSFLSEILPMLNSENKKKHKPDKYLMYRIFYISIIPILLLNILFYFFSPEYYLLNIPIILIIGLNAIYRYKKAYFKVDDSIITIGSGNFISTVKTVAELHKTQAVSFNQTIFQKRRNLGTLVIYTAGKSLKIPHIPIAFGQQLKNFLLFKVEFENKDWM